MFIAVNDAVMTRDVLSKFDVFHRPMPGHMKITEKDYHSSTYDKMYDPSWGSLAFFLIQKVQEIWKQSIFLKVLISL